MSRAFSPLLALLAAVIAVESAVAQVPGVGPGRRIGNCWTDESGVNHCDGDGAAPEKPEKPPRTGGPSEADRIAANKKAAKKIADAAERLFYKDDYAGAEREYRRALSLHDGDKDAWFTLGWAIHLQGRPGEALNAYKRAADLGHRKAKKRYEELLASETAQREARRQEEQRRWNQDQTRRRTYEEALRLEGQSGGYAAAARLWLDFLRRYPDDVYAISSFARCVYFSRLVDPNTPRELVDAAIAASLRAIRLEPSSGAHDRRLLLLLARAGRTDEAVVHAREAANKERDLAALKEDFYNATEWALDQGDYAGFERILTAGAHALPGDWVKSRFSFLRMAQYKAAVSAGNNGGAVSASRALVALYPKNYEYGVLLGSSLLRSGENEEGKAVFAAEIRRQNGIGKSTILGEFISVHVGDTKDWRALLDGGREMLAAFPVDDKFDRAGVAGGHAELATALLRLNRPVEARAELDVYLNHPAEMGDAWFWSLRMRGDEFEKMGLAEFSILVNERALALKPGDADTMAKLARLRASAERERLALRPLVPAVPSGPGGVGTVSPDAPAVDGNGFEGRLATSGDDIVRHARELRRQAGLPREGRTVVPIPFSVWEKKIRDGQGLTPAELAAFSRNDWNYLGRLIVELHRDGETSGEALTGRDLGRRASEAADRSGEWIARNRETVEAAADLLEYGSIAVLPASVPISVALGGAETSLSVLAKLLILKSEHPDKADVPKALAWIIGPEAVKKIGGDKLKTVFLQAGIPETRALQLGAMTIKEAVDSVGYPSGR